MPEGRANEVIVPGVWVSKGGTMNKLALLLVVAASILAFVLCAGPEIARAKQSAPPPASEQQPAPGATRSAAPEPAPRIVTAYTLPPDLYEKTKHLEKVSLVFLAVGTIYGLVVLWLFLAWRLGPKYRDWAERASTKFLLQVAMFAPLFVLTIDVLELPLRIFEHWEGRNYGLSVEGWGAWAWDWTKSEIVGVIIAIIAISILYAVIRKSPRWWWFFFWLASLPLAMLLAFLQPLVVDPLFHKFEPMQEKDPALTAELEQIVQRAGDDIPPERIYWMNASEKVNELNAYVTGLGASKRIVVWDTTIAKMTTPQIAFVAGHEMGHYVLHHISKGLVIFAVGSLAAFCLAYRLIGWLLAWRGARWEVRSVGDFASLPALVLLLTVFLAVLTPVTNAISRYFEHQADQYGLEVTHGLTPDSGEVAAQSFQILGQVNLEYPDPNPLAVILTYDHPPTRDRIRFALTYDRWAHGGHGEFVH